MGPEVVEEARGVETQDMDRPRPFAFYEMIQPPNTAKAGEECHIVVFKARLCGLPKDLPKEEDTGCYRIDGGAGDRGLERRPTLSELVEEGVSVVAGGETVSWRVQLYPIGTAVALAHILRHTMKEG